MKALIGALACLVAFTGAAQAETYRLRYQAQVLGVVTLGTASYQVSYDASRYSTQASVQTSGLARLFDQTRVSANSSGGLSAAGPAWSNYALSHAYAQKSRRVDMRRSGSAVQATVSPRYGDMGRPPASAAQQSASYDPVSALFALGRQVAADRACANNAVLVFDGRSHYRLALGGGTNGTFNGGGYTGAAIRCSISYQPISGFPNLQQARGAPVGEVWFGLSSRQYAPLLQLTVPTPLGAAQLNLQSYEAS